MSNDAYEILLNNIDPVRDAHIDKYNLDEEARTLPEISQRYNEIIYKYLTPGLNDAKFQLEKEEAVARRDVRLHATAEGRKITKDEVENELSCMPALLKLRREVRSLETEIAYYKGMMNTIDAKRSSLNNLVSLYVKDYYSTQADDGKYRQADVAYSRTEGNDYDDYKERQSKKLSDAMKRRRK